MAPSKGQTASDPVLSPNPLLLSTHTAPEGPRKFYTASGTSSPHNADLKPRSLLRLDIHIQYSILPITYLHQNNVPGAIVNHHSVLSWTQCNVNGIGTLAAHLPYPCVALPLHPL